MLPQRWNIIHARGKAATDTGRQERGNGATVAATNAMSIQKSLVLGGHGLTILPPIAFASELANKQLSAATLVDPRITRTIVLALPANRPIGQHVRRTAELLFQCAQECVSRKQWLQATWIAARSAVAPS